jgi:S-ribosylhomocysteine lyase
MEKIASFKVDHLRLTPGIYVSRKDIYAGEVITTLDIRMCRPNFDDPLTPEVSHTIEHFGATYFRNDPDIKNDVVYFGPMGCLTGFYFILHRDLTPGTPEYTDIVSRILSMMQFIVNFRGILIDLGFDPGSCGNYSLNDMDGARTAAANFLVLNDTLGSLKFIYPTEENSPELCISSKIGGTNATTRAADYAKYHAQEPVIDYTDKVEVKYKKKEPVQETQEETLSESDKYISEFNSLKPKKRPVVSKEKKKKKEEPKVISNTLF